MVEEKKEKKEAGAGDFKALAKFFKESYLEGVEVALSGQEETEKLVKEAISQGVAIPRAGLKLSRQWLQVLGESGSVSSGVPNPWLTFSRQCTEAICGGAEPLFDASEEAFNTGVSMYDKVVAIPMRKYAREFNRRCLEALIPG